MKKWRRTLVPTQIPFKERTVFKTVLIAVLVCSPEPSVGNAPT